MSFTPSYAGLWHPPETVSLQNTLINRVSWPGRPLKIIFSSLSLSLSLPISLHHGSSSNWTRSARITGVELIPGARVIGLRIRNV